MQFNRRSLLAGSALGLVASKAIAPIKSLAQTGGWTVTDLLALEGEVDAYGSTVQGSITNINDNGEVTGSLVASDTKISPTIWQPSGKGKRLKSGEFGGQVLAINNNGIAVGQSFLGLGGYDPSEPMEPSFVAPAIWVDGEPVDLGMPGVIGRFTDVNDDGIAIGYGRNEETRENLAFTWQAGTLTPLSTLDTGSGYPQWINASGVIGGRIGSVFDGQQMGTWVDGTFTPIPPIPAELTSAEDRPEGITFYMEGITDSGDVLLSVALPSETYSPNLELFWYRDETFTRIEGPSADQPNFWFPIVGRDGTLLVLAGGESTSPNTRFLVGPDGDFEDIEPVFASVSDYTGREAVAINRNGTILVRAYNEDEAPHALIFSRS